MSGYLSSEIWLKSYLNRWRCGWFISDCVKLFSPAGTTKSQMPYGPITRQVSPFSRTKCMLTLTCILLPIPYGCAPLTQSLVWDFSWRVGGFQPVDSWWCPARAGGIWAMLAKLEAWPLLNTYQVSKWRATLQGFKCTTYSTHFSSCTLKTPFLRTSVFLVNSKRMSSSIPPLSIMPDTLGLRWVLLYCGYCQHGPVSVPCTWWIIH